MIKSLLFFTGLYGIKLVPRGILDEWTYPTQHLAIVYLSEKVYRIFQEKGLDLKAEDVSNNIQKKF